MLPRHELGPEDLERDLGRLWPHYESSWVALLGGEPLLHRDLVGVIEATHRAAPSARVAVVTNGTQLPRMSDAFWAAIDGVQVCLYPGKELGPEELRGCRAKADAHGVPMVVTRIDRFRESYSETGTADDALVGQIYDACELKFGHTIADGRFYKCPPSHFLPKVIDGLEPGAEGVLLDDEPDLGERLRAHLADNAPLQACRHCLGSSGRRFPQAQAPRAAFRELQRTATEGLLDRRLLRKPGRVRRQLVRLTPRYYRERRLM